MRTSLAALALGLALASPANARTLQQNQWDDYHLDAQAMFSAKGADDINKTPDNRVRMREECSPQKGCAAVYYETWKHVAEPVNFHPDNHRHDAKIVYFGDRWKWNCWLAPTGVETCQDPDLSGVYIRHGVISGDSIQWDGPFVYRKPSSEIEAEQRAEMRAQEALDTQAELARMRAARAANPITAIADGIGGFIREADKLRPSYVPNP